MTRFISTRLDLSRLAGVRPDLILDLDFEAILAARKTSLQARFDAIGAATGTDPVDVLSLETEPAVILQQEDAYRQLLDYGLLNERFRGLLPAFSRGTDLDHLVSRAGVTRLVLTRDQDGNPLTYEDDATLVMRYLAAFGAPSAGSEDAYIFNTLTTYPQAWHVYCVGPAEHGDPGRVDIVVTAPDGQPVPNPTLFAINYALNAPNVRPLTDIVNVVGAEVAPYTVVLEAEILRGPDPAAIKGQIEANLARITLDRYRGGGEVQLSALASGAFEAGAIAVDVTSPGADIPRDPYVAPWATSITVTVTERLND